MSVCIFDLDGTLVDSQELYRTTSNQAFKLYGVGFQISREAWLAKVVHGGMPATDFIKFENLPIDIEEYKLKRNKLFWDRAETELRAMPGAVELVKLLYKNNYQLAVASHSRLSTIEHALEIHGLTDCFQLCISDQDVPHGKPAPDVYLEAAKQLKIKPADCLVFEDSQAGLAAAKSAGMKCIVCPDRYSALPRKHFIKADLVVDSLAEINLTILKNL